VTDVCVVLAFACFALAAYALRIRHRLARAEQDREWWRADARRSFAENLAQTIEIAGLRCEVAILRRKLARHRTGEEARTG
jgi:hypothetical protein